MISRAAVFITESWYRGAMWLYILFPLALLYWLIILIRKGAYRLGLLSIYRSSLPVVVVGNVTVGGTGKSPLVAGIVRSLREQGYTPGIISRGYGADLRRDEVREVHRNSRVSEVGDEPLMLKRALACRVMVSPSRVLAVQALEKTECDIVVADDGLQHYALDRDIEICVFDGQRKWGNGSLLPVGPMREPLKRIDSCDFVVVNGDNQNVSSELQRSPDSLFSMRLEPGLLRSVGEEQQMTVALDDWDAASVHAVAAIGNPERFFSTLEQRGLEVHRHPFEDHHLFTAADFAFANDLPIIMTEKDAVKCQHLALANAWHLPVSAVLNGDPGAELIKLLKKKGWFDG